MLNTIQIAEIAKSAKTAKISLSAQCKLNAAKSGVSVDLDAAEKRLELCKEDYAEFNVSKETEEYIEEKIRAIRESIFRTQSKIVSKIAKDLTVQVKGDMVAIKAANKKANIAARIAELQKKLDEMEN